MTAVEKEVPIPPYRELKAFQKVFLNPGETKTVTLTLPPDAFSFWDVQTHDWKTEPGKFKLLIGNSSRDVQQMIELTVPETKTN